MVRSTRSAQAAYNRSRSEGWKGGIGVWATSAPTGSDYAEGGIRGRNARGRKSGADRELPEGGRDQRRGGVDRVHYNPLAQGALPAVRFEPEVGRHQDGANAEHPQDVERRRLRLGADTDP